MRTSELLRRQDELQREALEVRADLGLDAHLSAHGEVVCVGSAALGLMVWRDLDLTVVSTRLDAEAVATTGARIATHQRVREVTFRNDTGRWNIDPTYPDGLYLKVQCASQLGEMWSVDIWFVDEPDRQPDLEHLRTLPQRLTAASRAAILTIKDAWAGRAEYGQQVRGWDIYTAVLDHGARTVDDFDTWVREAGPDRRG
ncbi:hypothetical protein ACLQ29_14140 [Micromonospora sp. DT228]|uniref:hypothetical protein n=1 Tax=Micromonospora sp. DT228 TaxID=3393443 RepID=UPI003CF54D17